MRRFVAFGIVVVAFAAGCATMTRMSSDDAIAARQKLMKEQGAAMRSISDKLKAGQIQAVATDAEKLQQTAREIPKLFPKDSVNPQTSRAKPEIWQDWSRFEGYAKTLESQATNLAATAKSGNPQDTSAAVATLGRQTCTACHDAFRGPELKKS